MDVSALDVHYLVQEWQDLLPARIQQIYQVDEAFVIVLHAKQQGKRLLYIAKNYVATIKEKPEAPEKPTQLAVVLRKYLLSAWIETITQEGFERVIHLTCKKESTRHVYIELFSSGNLILCDADGKIMHAQHMREWKHRTIKRNEMYTLPPQLPNVYTLSQQQCATLLEADKPTVNVLAVQLGLGGTYAEETCSMAGIDKKLPAKDQPEGNIEKIYAALQQLIHRPLQPTQYERAFPFPLQIKGESKPIASFSDGLGTTVPEKDAPVKETKQDRIVSAQEEQLIKLRQEEAEERLLAEKIYEHYTYLHELLATVKDMQKKQGWQAVKAALKKDVHIIDIDESKGLITVELP